MSLLQPANLLYKGAFRLPSSGGVASSFDYGGLSLAFYPGGKGGAGSLYISGHVDDKMIAEISIPAPVNSHTLSSLNTASYLQTFADITGGKKSDVPVDGAGQVGVLYLPKQGSQSTDKVYWQAWVYYGADGINRKSTGWSQLTLSSPSAQGTWFVGTYHSAATSQNMCEIDKTWADTNVGGKYIGCRRTDKEAGGTAFAAHCGPGLYAIGPWLDGNPPANTTQLSATPLLFYPDSAQDDPGLASNAGPHHYPAIFGSPAYRALDFWRGFAWLNIGSETAFLIVGRKQLDFTHYGEQTFTYNVSNVVGTISGNGEDTGAGATQVTGLSSGVTAWVGDGSWTTGAPTIPLVLKSGTFTIGETVQKNGSNHFVIGTINSQDLEGGKGYHATSYEALFLFYDPADLASVAAGSLNAYDPIPYAVYRPTTELFNVDNSYRFGGMAYDRTNQKLYFTEYFVDDARPVVHVYQVIASSAVSLLPPALSVA